MSLNALMTPQTAQEAPLFHLGRPDVGEAVGVTLEAYRALGYAGGDPDELAQDLTTAFDERAKLGYAGRVYVPVPAAVSFASLINTAEGKRPEGIGPVVEYKPLWRPSTEEESYTEDELDIGPAKPLARLALFNANQDTGVDPLLHHLGLPFDDDAQREWGGETTQLKAVEADKVAFSKQHPELELAMTDHRDFLLFALMDRIRGERVEKPLDPRSAEFVLNRGFKRVLLGRRTVDGASVVGYVDSSRGRLGLRGSSGGAGSNCGVGLSVGPKEL